jgi:hypothetical protein
MKYTIEIRETLIKLVHIDAPNIDVAQCLVEEKYKREELVLNSDDFFCVDFIVGNSKVYPYSKSDS